MCLLIETDKKLLSTPEIQVFVKTNASKNASENKKALTVKMSRPL